MSARRLTFVAVALVDRRRAARQEKALLFQVSSRFAYTIRRLHTLVLPVVSILFVNTWQPRQRPRVARDRHRYHQRRARTPKARQRNAQGPKSVPPLHPSLTARTRRISGVAAATYASVTLNISTLLFSLYPLFADMNSTRSPTEMCVRTPQLFLLPC